MRPGAAATRIRLIFAAKTTAAAIIALTIAFTFDLDQPQWALLTVFIVAQPQSGLVLAKSFYRVLGTLTGAAMALLLVGLFAQERVLFLGALALWIGLCTFASQYARNVSAYAFVLSGYTAAIVGIPGALTPGQAFFIAVARVTEVGLGIIITATINHLVLPMSLAPSLRGAIAAARRGLADHAVALLNGDDGAALTKLLDAGRTIGEVSASAVFENREIRDRRTALRRLDLAFTKALSVGESCRRQLAAPGRTDGAAKSALDEAIARAGIALRDWRDAVIGAAQLGARLVDACAAIAPAEQLRRAMSVPDAEVVSGIAAAASLREFLASIVGYARAYEALASGEKRRSRPLGGPASNDLLAAAWPGVRAALALVIVSIFWIVADWPRGPTAVILSAVVTARLATMENGGKAAIAGAMVLALATFPAFVVVEVLLPAAQGIEMFILVVAPVLFLCAYLMGSTKPPLAYLAGFLGALYVASVGGFQDEMSYDAVGFVNTSIAVVFAVAVGAVLFAVVAPETPAAARRHFRRAVRQLWASTAAPDRRPGLGGFERAAAEALERFRPEAADDVATWMTGAALLAAGRDLIRLRRDARASSVLPALGRDIAALARRGNGERLERARKQVQAAVAQALADLRDSAPDAAAARAALRRIAALSAMDSHLERGGAFLVPASPWEVPRNAA